MIVRSRQRQGGRPSCPSAATTVAGLWEIRALAASVSADGPPFAAPIARRTPRSRIGLCLRRHAALSGWRVWSDGHSGHGAAAIHVYTRPNGGLDEVAVCQFVRPAQSRRPLFGPGRTRSIMASPAAELKVARQILGWDALTMARALRLVGTPEKLEARIQDMEAGKRDISGPVKVAIEAFSGWRPTGWVEPV